MFYMSLSSSFLVNTNFEGCWNIFFPVQNLSYVECGFGIYRRLYEV